MIDLIIVVITAILIIGGYKRGLVHSVMELLGTAISAVISSFGASLVSAGIYQAFVKDYIYVGSVLKCIVILPNGNELKIERLSGQELPTIGSRIYPYWEPEDGVLIHNDSYKIFKALESIKLA